MPDSATLPSSSALFTDQYELTMARAYLAEGMCGRAVFELFFRTLPENRSFIMSAGLADVIAALESLRFTEEDLGYLARQKDFDEPFLEQLRSFRFTGDVHAVPEGSIVFPGEPLVQIAAPIVEAQLIETLVLNQIHFQSILATKAARIVLAAGGRPVVDFGARRAHGYDAALKAARACYIAGGAATSNVLAGALYGIPIAGTMAHSYVQAHDDEACAFERFNDLFPGTTLLVDTYDTIAGVRKVIDLARCIGPRFKVSAVRLDSGDLLRLSRQTRAMLDEAGLTDIRIFASGGLDEYQIHDLLHAGAPVDGFGVGTSLAVSADAPALDMAYKLVSYEGQPRLKLSSEKSFHPGRKQVFRERREGLMARDVLALHDEAHPGEALLQPIVEGGRRVQQAPDLRTIREHAARQLDLLPEALRALRPSGARYPVEVSEKLQAERAAAQESLSSRT